MPKQKLECRACGLAAEIVNESVAVDVFVKFFHDEPSRVHFRVARGPHCHHSLAIISRALVYTRNSVEPTFVMYLAHQALVPVSPTLLRPRYDRSQRSAGSNKGFTVLFCPVLAVMSSGEKRPQAGSGSGSTASGSQTQSSARGRPVTPGMNLATETFPLLVKARSPVTEILHVRAFEAIWVAHRDGSIRVRNAKVCRMPRSVCDAFALSFL